jgi:hypothetical protein
MILWKRKSSNDTRRGKVFIWNIRDKKKSAVKSLECIVCIHSYLGQQDITIYPCLALIKFFMVLYINS